MKNIDCYFSEGYWGFINPESNQWQAIDLIPSGFKNAKEYLQSQFPDYAVEVHDLTQYLKLEECVRGKIYSLRSSNLDIGVFDGKNGFIGIRQKYNKRYLDVEYHYDALYGTAKPLKEIDVLPGWIDIKEHLGTICQRCGRPCKGIPGDQGYYAWEHIPWSKYVDYDESIIHINDLPKSAPFDFGDCKASPTGLNNKYLFDFLEEVSRGFS